MIDVLRESCCGLRSVRRFIVGGFIVQVATRLIPGRRRKMFSEKGSDGSTMSMRGVITNRDDPFTDQYLMKPLPLAAKLRLIALAPLGLWRWTMLSGVTISYLVVANVVVLVVRGQGMRYRILKPITKHYLSRVSLWIMGMR